MRPWRIVAASVAVPCCALAAEPAARADSAASPRDAGAAGAAGDVAASADRGEPAPQPPQRIGYGALPGGLHVATAETLPVGTVELALLSGFGYRPGLLSKDHSFDRAIGDIAVAYAPLPSFAIALSFDGRYDKHTGFAGMSDDGYVGDPHLLLRLAAPSGKVSFGGQLGVWIPGKNAPSIAGSAISIDARALVSFEAGFGTLSASAGFRLDNSAKSVDQRTSLSVEDQVSLGDSDYNAALAGVSLRMPVGPRAYVALEASTDAFVGSGAPGPILRGGGLFGVSLTDAVSIIGYVEGAKGPGVKYSDAAQNKIALVPYEPLVTGGLGLQARFGGARRSGDSQITVNAHKEPVVVVETAEVTGAVVDEAGRPVVGAEVRVKLKNYTGNAVSDDRGIYTVGKLPIGKTVDGKTELDDTGAEISAEVANKKPGTATLTLTRGNNTVPRIALDPMLPPGQLRAVIHNVANGRPVANATVTIEPGGATATTGPDGKFSVDLPPGHYKITVTAKGLAQQQLDVNIDPNGVAIKNIDMHR
jgi:hypothetical protein